MVFASSLNLWRREKEAELSRERENGGEVKRRAECGVNKSVKMRK